MCTGSQTIVKALMALGFILLFNYCASQNTSHQPTPQELPAGSPVTEPETSSEAAPAPSRPEPRLYVHTVRWPGESLSHIAQWYTGAARNWKGLVEFNPELDPNRIFIGDQIFIPEDLLKTRKPMPRDFLPSPVRNKGAQPPPVEQPAKESEEMQLYGPIE